MSVAAQSERGLAVPASSAGRRRWRRCWRCCWSAAAAEIVLDGAAGLSPLIPKSPDIAGWLQGIGERLGFRVFLIALLVSTGAYAGLIVARRAASAAAAPCAISKRWAIVLVAALQLIVFAGPILLSTDVFSYIAYARMGVEHGLNPYLHGPVAIVSDPVFPYVGEDWIHVATAYGPLYTLLSYPLAPLGVVGALWGMKLEALLASAGTLALTWRCARARGFDPVAALLIVGANPLYVIYGLGGAHNDLIMMLAMMAAVSLSIAGTPQRRREAGAAAWVVAGALIEGHRRGAAAVHDPLAHGAWRRSSAPSRRSRWARSSATPSSASTASISSRRSTATPRSSPPTASPPRSRTCSASRACSRSTTTCSRRRSC